MPQASPPQQLIAFEPSPEANRRVRELTERERDGELTGDEKAELDHFMQLEHILRMAKAKAREVLTRGN